MRWFLCFLLFAPVVVAADYFPFVYEWDDAQPSLVDLSGRLERPAGKKGFITVKDGHLSLKGERIRLFGVNLCFGACFPRKEDADKIAAHMAKLGVACVRFHHMDTQRVPDGMIRADGKTIDTAMLDRFDYFVAALKARGIYVDINLHVGRVYPGWPTWPEMPAYFKGVDQFFPPMIEAQKEFAKALLTHKNPYTKTTYANEPAVAFVEINNENSLLEQWWNGALDAMPDPYWSELRAQWKAWLIRYAGSEEKALELTKEGREPLGENVLGKGGWLIEQHGSAKASVREWLANGWNVRVENGSDLSWHVQFLYPGLFLKSGKPYTFSFEVVSKTARRINVALIQNGPPWKVLWQKSVEAGPQKRKYSLVMSPGAYDGSARIGFNNMGGNAGAYLFSNMEFRPGVDLQNEPFELLRKGEFAGYGVPLQKAWIRFLWETEQGYWREMARYLRTDLKVKSLLVGGQVGFSPIPLQAEMDVVDVHGYWQHPVFPGVEWDPANWSVGQASMAGDAKGGVLADMAMMRVAGKPFIVTEYSHPAPNAHASEGFPLLGAYAALQDWDAVFAFAYSHRRSNWGPGYVTGFFDIDQHPTKLATLPLLQNLFVRGDVATPQIRSKVGVSTEAALETTRLGGPVFSGEAFGLSREAFFHHPVSVSVDGKGELAHWEEKGRMTDDGSLLWVTRPEQQNGYVLVNTEKTKGIIGSAAGRRFGFDTIAITPGQTRSGSAVILMTEMEPSKGFWKPTPRRFLISATADTQNAGMRWHTPTSVGRDWGHAPSLVEGVRAVIEFRREKDRATPRVWALDSKGQRKEEIPLHDNALEIGPQYQTLWYEVEW